MESWRIAILASMLPLAAGLHAQEARVTTPQPRQLTVRCVDKDGEPVARAEVHVFQWKPLPDGSRTIVHDGPLQSGDNGCVAIEDVVPENAWQLRWAYARIADQLVGAVSTDPKERPRTEMTIVLEPSRIVRGRVKVPTGTRLEDVKIRVLRLEVNDGNETRKRQFPRQSGFGLHDTLPERFDCGVQADGTFTLRDMPRNPSLYLAVTGPGLAETQWPSLDEMLAMARNQQHGDPIVLPDPIEVTAPAEAVFAGIVRSPDGTAAAGTRVELRLDYRGRTVQSSFVATTDEGGRFRIGGLPEGDYDLMVSSTAGEFELQLA